ncbi:MAG: phage holin family protein [Gloeocapsa sp. UFS-A4-WI-NPMV-4B04]|jgi:putative membrane protein|nr:phage holin family protein [Gloeocapsa sp. UFS-A4-WI-NPMV-4B04]
MLVDIAIAWLVSASSLLLVTQLPIGVEVDSTPKAYTSAAVIGIVAAVVNPILRALFFIPNLLTFGLLSGFVTFIISAIALGAAASLLPGFRLKAGVVSALLGALALSVVSNLIYGFVS